MNIIDISRNFCDRTLHFTDKALDSKLAWTIVGVASFALIAGGIIGHNIFPAIAGAMLLGSFNGLKISQVVQKALFGGTLGKPDEEKVKEVKQLIHSFLPSKFFSNQYGHDVIQLQEIEKQQ